MRPLEIVSTTAGDVVIDPFVVEGPDPNDHTLGDRLRFSDDDTSGSTLLYNDHAKTVILKVNSLTVTPDASKITLDTDDGELTVRRVMDDDGVWASAVGGLAPADSLEQVYLGGRFMAQVAYSDPTESLWAALDPDSGVLRELVYSSPSGIYVRSSGGWFKQPDDDISLDGLEAVDVSGDFVPVFDEADNKAEELTRDSVMSYALPDEAPEPQEAA
jgi:hypothetical protein